MTQTTPLYRLTASLDRDGQILDMDTPEVLGDDYRTRWTSREAAEARAAEMTGEMADYDLDPDTTVSVTEVDDIPDPSAVIVDPHTVETILVDVLTIDGSDTKRAIDVEVRVLGLEAWATLTPMTSGQGYEASGPLDSWLSAGPLQTLIAAQSDERAMRRLAAHVALIAASAADAYLTR